VVKLIPDSYVACLDPEKIFDRLAPLHVDLGCGDGSFLCALAERHPEKNFLGIERMNQRMTKACRRARPLENVRVLHLETSYAVRYLLPAGSVAVFYLLFPDPWPKRRHHRRRIVTIDFLTAIEAALQEDGIFRIATDHLDYFRQIERLIRAETPELSSCSRLELLPSDDVDLPLSKFERRFRETGAPIYWLTLRKTSWVT
jgi:tRNA (guanine-N7-)-methyltransferase